MICPRGPGGGGTPLVIDGSALLVVCIALVSSPLLSGDVLLTRVEELVTSGAVRLSAIKARTALVSARLAAVQVLLAAVLILLAAVLPGVDGTPGRGDLSIDDLLLTFAFPIAIHPPILSPELVSFTPGHGTAAPACISKRATRRTRSASPGVAWLPDPTPRGPDRVPRADSQGTISQPHRSRPVERRNRRPALPRCQHCQPPSPTLLRNFRWRAGPRRSSAPAQPDSTTEPRRHIPAGRVVAASAHKSYPPQQCTRCN